MQDSTGRGSNHHQARTSPTGGRPPQSIVRALVVHRDPDAASTLVAALQNGVGPVEAVTLNDPGRLPEALGDGRFQVLVCGLCDREEVERAVDLARAAEVTLVLTERDAHRPNGARGRVAHEPERDRLADTVERERASDEDRRSAARAARLLDAQRELAGRLAAELAPDELLAEALRVLGELFGARGGVAWDLAPRGDLRPRRTWGRRARRRSRRAARSRPPRPGWRR